MDQSVLSTNVPSLLQASATILDNLQIAIDAVESEQAKDVLDNLYSAADHFNDLALFILSNCSTSQQALKDAHISTETIEVITGVLTRSEYILDTAVEFSQVVCSNADRDDNNSSNDNDGISAIIQELESDYTALLKGVVIGMKGLDVILSLTQVWLDVTFKAKPTVLGLSLAVLQESITSLNNLTSGPDSSTTPFSSLCRAAQSVHSSILTSNPDTTTPPAVMVASGARNLFHTYIGQGDYDEVKELLDAGIDAMSPGPQGLHPVHFAAYCGELEIVRLLAQYGADTWAVSGPNGETPLLLAAAAGNLDVVEFLMEQEGADVDCVSDMHGATALLCACDYGHLDVVRFLVVGRKANLFIADKEGSTPLMKAVRAQHRELVGLLLENVHLELPDSSKEDGTNDDDVRAATIQRDLTAAKLFLEVGAADLSVSGQEKTPLQEAIGHGIDGVMEYLLSEALKAMDLDIGSKDSQLGHPLNALDYMSDVRDEVGRCKLELEEQAQHFLNDIEDLEHLGASAV